MALAGSPTTTTVTPPTVTATVTRTCDKHWQVTRLRGLWRRAAGAAAPRSPKPALAVGRRTKVTRARVPRALPHPGRTRAAPHTHHPRRPLATYPPPPRTFPADEPVPDSIAAVEAWMETSDATSFKAASKLRTNQKRPRSTKSAAVNRRTEEARGDRRRQVAVASRAADGATHDREPCRLPEKSR